MSVLLTTSTRAYVEARCMFDLSNPLCGEVDFFSFLFISGFFS